MNSQELRTKFLDFFKSKGHEIVPSSSLVPENDPTVLFNVAGMQPLVPYLSGAKHPQGEKLTNIQRCIRTIDIDEVGDKTHTTFFEMLGYWSLGSYWKQEAINLTYEFLTKELNIDPAKIAVTCFEGDQKNDIDRDDESAEIWKSLGIAEERIAFLGYDDNWWGPAGATGPCGPDTEIFAWTGAGDAPEKYDPTDKKWVEIGNDVFMAFSKNGDGQFAPLVQKNVDFGAGFERILMVLNGFDDVYMTDLFTSLIAEIELISGQKYADKTREFRIIADHIKAAVALINDGVVPSNKDRGYILRRLIRRAIVKAKQIGIEENFTAKIAQKVFEIYTGTYEFDDNNVIAELEKEEIRFRQTLVSALNDLESYQNMTSGDFPAEIGKKYEIDGEILFNLYQSKGLPLEVSLEEAERLGIPVKKDAAAIFEVSLKNHQELSRTASAGMFKGGLVGQTEQTTKYHSATHLLLAALRQVLGSEVHQRGSNITDERLRVDFSWPEKMTDEQIKETENIVNEKIQADLPVSMEEMTQEDAKNCGAIGEFGDKYGFKVKVYTMGDFSKEICGGPHVERTGELGHFKITKEESSSSGVRRIKAILE